MIPLKKKRLEYPASEVTLGVQKEGVLKLLELLETSSWSLKTLWRRLLHQLLQEIEQRCKNTSYK